MNTIKVNANHAKRTFTIRMIDEAGKVYAKYRTCQFNKEEFESNLYNTPGDWRHWLRKEDFYYTVK